MDRDALGDFLRSRRAVISPGEVGLPTLGRRRVPGLRREEVAQLAGVSPDYYIRLEQGRSRNVSDAVLDAVARVLRLGTTEREHLFNLARPASKAAAPPRQRIRPGVLRHPQAGELRLTYETLALPGDPDQMLVTYAAPVGSPTHERLLVLAGTQDELGRGKAA